LADIERGRSFPSIPFLVSLIEKCDVCLGWLLTGVESARRHGSAAAMASPSDEEEAAFFAILKTLWRLFQEGDNDTRGWVKVQLKRAIPEVEDM
jgi:hypothetical protein